MYNNARITRRGSHAQGRRVRSLAGRFRTLKTTTIKQMMTYYFFPLSSSSGSGYVFHISLHRVLLSPSVTLSPPSRTLSLSLYPSLCCLSLHRPYFVQPNSIYIYSPIYIIHRCVYSSVIEIVFCTLLLHAHVTYPSTLKRDACNTANDFRVWPIRQFKTIYTIHTYIYRPVRQRLHNIAFRKRHI